MVALSTPPAKVMGKIDMSKDLKLQRQKGLGGIGNPTTVGADRGISTESQQSKCSLPVPSGSISTSPLLNRGGQYHHHPHPLHTQQSDTSGTKSDSKRETFKWSGVTVSFDADSIKIENEVNGGPPGIRKEVSFKFFSLDFKKKTVLTKFRLHISNTSQLVLLVRTVYIESFHKEGESRNVYTLSSIDKVRIRLEKVRKPG